jgi:hypothetical protein
MAKHQGSTRQEAAALICCQCDAPGPADREAAEAEGWRSVGYVNDPHFSYALPICPDCAREKCGPPKRAVVLQH